MPALFIGSCVPSSPWCFVASCSPVLASRAARARASSPRSQRLDADGRRGHAPGPLFLRLVARARAQGRARRQTTGRALGCAVTIRRRGRCVFRARPRRARAARRKQKRRQCGELRRRRALLPVENCCSPSRLAFARPRLLPPNVQICAETAEQRRPRARRNVSANNAVFCTAFWGSFFTPRRASLKISLPSDQLSRHHVTASTVVVPSSSCCPYQGVARCRAFGFSAIPINARCSAGSARARARASSVARITAVARSCAATACFLLHV